MTGEEKQEYVILKFVINDLSSEMSREDHVFLRIIFGCLDNFL